MKEFSLNSSWAKSHTLYSGTMFRSVCSLFLLAFAAVCGLSSCSEKVEDNPSVPTNGFIGFTVSDGSGISYITDEEKTISASSRTPVQTASAKSSDGIEFFLEETTLDEFCTETPDSDGLMEYEKALTRGAQVESVSAMGDFSDFAYYADGTPFDRIQNLKVGTDGRTNVRWPGLTDDRKPLRFYAAHPYNAGTFTPSATEFKCAFTVNTTVANQKDLLYASTGVVSYNDQTTSFLVPLHFHHALAAVKVKVGAIGNYVKSINSVTFKGVYTRGTYTLPTTDVAQTGSTGWSTDLGGQTDITLGSLNLTSWTSGTDITDGANTFLMIPQDLNDITLEVGITTAEDTKEALSFPLSGGNAWQQGRTRIYTITTSKTMTVKYPTNWTNVDGGGAVQGPITQYDANETFGLFAVDPTTGKVMLSNIPVTNKNGGTESGIILEDGHVYSAKYDYYLYYPRRTDVTSFIPAENSTVTANTADGFFANLIANWSVSDTQNTLSAFKAQDLQIAKLDKGTNKYQMVHKMGLVKLALGSASRANTLTWNFTASTAGTAYTSATSNNATYTASSKFEDATTKRLYSSSGYWTIVEATSASANTRVDLASVVNTQYEVASSSDNNNGWSTTVSNVGYGKYRLITVYPTHVPTKFVANFPYNDCYKNSTNATYKKYHWHYSQPYTITLPRDGKYKLDVYGATYGGPATTPNGGGRTYGYYLTTQAGGTKTLYVCVGGQGVVSANSPKIDLLCGGYNGGGAGQEGGGGATHIATNKRGVLSNYQNYTGEVLVVAGGGGGSDGAYGAGWGGGGINKNGENGTAADAGVGYGTGATHASGGYSSNNTTKGKGSFGQGGASGAEGYVDCAGAGGGGWYGGGGSWGHSNASASYTEQNKRHSGCGGGGSSHVNGSKITDAGGGRGPQYKNHQPIGGSIEGDPNGKAIIEFIM
ncbi:MAG: fimbrillin family protein [Prevotella sp.]|nr:fimbrillin family protein [Prevotella sp.]